MNSENGFTNTAYQAPAFGKASGSQTIKAAEALEEALCFEWIDGQIQRIDDKTYKNIFPCKENKASGQRQTKHCSRA